MQTFLPYSDFKKTAQCLDYRRLGKQRVEAWQIYLTLIHHSNGWQNHPAVKMWKDSLPALIGYGFCICQEWINRGYKDSMSQKFHSVLMQYEVDGEIDLKPVWMGDEKFHLSHQSNLVRKFPEHYKKYFPTVPDNLPYIWPIR